MLSALHGAGRFLYIQVCPPNANPAMSRSQQCLQRAARTHGGRKHSAWRGRVRGQGQERKVAGVPRGFLNEAAISPATHGLEMARSGVCSLIQQYGDHWRVGIHTSRRRLCNRTSSCCFSHVSQCWLQLSKAYLLFSEKWTKMLPVSLCPETFHSSFLNPLAPLNARPKRKIRLAFASELGGLPSMRLVMSRRMFSVS